MDLITNSISSSLHKTKWDETSSVIIYNFSPGKTGTGHTTRRPDLHFVFVFTISFSHGKKVLKCEIQQKDSRKWNVGCVAFLCKKRFYLTSICNVLNTYLIFSGIMHLRVCLCAPASVNVLLSIKEIRFHIVIKYFETPNVKFLRVEFSWRILYESRLEASFQRLISRRNSMHVLTAAASRRMSL